MADFAMPLLVVSEPSLMVASMKKPSRLPWLSLARAPSERYCHIDSQRRVLLKSLAGGALCLPLLETFAASNHDASVEIAPKRLLCIGNGLGFLMDRFTPEGSGGVDYQPSEYLELLANHRQQFSVFTQLDHGDEGRGGHGGTLTFLTGVNRGNYKNYVDGAMSVDQKLAAVVGDQTRFASLHFATQTGDPSHARTPLAWSRTGVMVPDEYRLSEIFNRLFVNPSRHQRQQIKQQIARKSSLLDQLLESARHLNQRVSQADREKLDQYFTSVRSTETQLQQQLRWLDKQKPKTGYALPSVDTDINSLSILQRLPIYYDLIALALQTDATRVLTFQIGGDSYRDLPEVHQGYHMHSHTGKLPVNIKAMNAIDRFQLQQFNRLLEKLKEIQEPNGQRLFDNTMTLFGSGMSNAAAHSNSDLPVLLAGYGFAHGQHLHFPKTAGKGTPLCNLYVSMLQRMGVEIDQFGSSTGSLTGLRAV